MWILKKYELIGKHTHWQKERGALAAVRDAAGGAAPGQSLEPNGGVLLGEHALHVAAPPRGHTAAAAAAVVVVVVVVSLLLSLSVALSLSVFSLRLVCFFPCFFLCLFLSVCFSLSLALALALFPDAAAGGG